MGGCLSYRLKFVRDQLPNEDTLCHKLTRFSYKTLQRATNNFSTRRLIREDQYSKTYKSTLKDGSVVIVKAYHDHPINGLDFSSMIKLMSRVRHQNVVELIGYCIEDDHKMLVHEYAGDYTLDQLLFPNSKVVDVVLDWPTRVSICHGIVRALDYLHNGISPRVVLNCVQPSNILMDCSFNPKIMYFDLSSILEDGESHQSGPFVGTLEYLDGEYLSTGRYSEKTDVYAFGITLLEIIHGNRNLTFLQDRECTILVDRTWELQGSGRIPEIVDPTVSEFSEDELTRFVIVALSCVQKPLELRPSMSQVRLMLSASYNVSNMVLKRPQVPTIWSSVAELHDNRPNVRFVFKY